MAVTAADLQKLYLAYFGRPADPSGIAFYTAQPNLSIWDVAAAFSASPESQTLYGSGFNSNVINNIYMNLFGRQAEPAGLLYWTQQVAAGYLTAAGAAEGILLGAQNADATAVANKLAVAATFTAHLDTTAEILAYAGDAAAAAARTFLAGVTSDPATVTTATANVDNAILSVVAVGGIGQAYSLTTGIDNIKGAGGNDTITGIYANGTGTTFTAFDTVDGGGGNDTLVISDAAGGTALPSGVNVTNVENLKLQSAGALTMDASSYSATNVSTGTVGTTITLTGSSTQNITATDANAGALVTVTGGASQTVTSAGGVVLSKAVGAISAVDTAGSTTALGAPVASTIDGGTSVSYTSTYAGGATAGAITIGGVKAPSGAITVKTSIAGDKTGGATGGAIAITGGTTVSVTETASQALTGVAGAQNTATQGAVTVNGGAATTSVTVAQTAGLSAKATAAAAGKPSITTIQFQALTAGQTTTVDGVTFTAGAAGATAKQVAAAFANLNSTNLPGYTSSAVSGTGSDTVAFTSTANGAAAVANATTGTALSVTATQAGVATTKAATGRGGIANGTVTIDGTNGGTVTSAITTVALNSYAGGSTIKSDVLSTLGIGGKTGTLTVTNAKATSLDLSLSGVSVNASLNNTLALGGTYTTLKIHTDTADSELTNLTGAAVATLTIDGTNAVSLDANALTALKTVTVSGAASVNGAGGAGLAGAADFSAGTVTDVNVSASSGANMVIIDPTKATFEGGTGNDTVVIAAAPTKAISGGAGNDTLYLNLTAATMSTPAGNTNISGFETLGLIGAASGTTYDATGFSHLTVDAVAGAVGFVNVAAGVDLSFTNNPGFNTTYALKDATGSTDSLAISMAMAGALNAQTVTAAGIETISIAANDLTAGVSAGATTDTIALTDTALKSLTVTGNTTLTLSAVGSTKLASVDASAMTGGITYTTAGTTAETVKGGAAGNTITALATGVSANDTADTLIGGAGNDVLTANGGQDTLTGNGGVDTFVTATAPTSVNAYATITDAIAGDLLKLKDFGTETYTAAKVTLQSTAVFSDYANAVINAGGNASANGYIGWFQYNGDTYVVESMHDATAKPTFQDGTDLIVKLTGLHDMSDILSVGGVPEIVVR